MMKTIKTRKLHIIHALSALLLWGIATSFFIPLFAMAVLLIPGFLFSLKTRDITGKNALQPVNFTRSFFHENLQLKLSERGKTKIMLWMLDGSVSRLLPVPEAPDH